MRSSGSGFGRGRKGCELERISNRRHCCDAFRFSSQIRGRQLHSHAVATKIWLENSRSRAKLRFDNDRFEFSPTIQGPEASSCISPMFPTQPLSPINNPATLVKRPIMSLWSLLPVVSNVWSSPRVLVRRTPRWAQNKMLNLKAASEAKYDRITSHDPYCSHSSVLNKYSLQRPFFSTFHWTPFGL